MKAVLPKRNQYPLISGMYATSRHSVLLVLLCLLLLPDFVQAFPAHSPVPGGIAQLIIAPVAAKRPIVHYAGQRVTVVPYDNQWVALIGLPLNANPGQHSARITHPVSQKQFDVAFQVIQKHYRTQRLTIQDKNKVTPNQLSTQRIIRELALQNQLKQRFTEREADLNFIKPVSGRDSGRFGLRRILNGQQRNPHSGMDIAAATGTPVHATASGVVLHTDDFFFSGRVVYVDHGSGVISLYAHLNDITVKSGDRVNQGSLLGHVGSTGRATGPHLHWSVYLNGQVIDPALFIPKKY